MNMLTTPTPIIIDTDPGSPHQVRLVGTGISSGVPAATLPAEENPGYRGDGDDD